ncbi:MAG: CARDB domain-containing protein, partial [Planctomycetota bacterium]|nr:CARDB domain-containing protein [Planctomycetota bacterium]
MFASNRQWSRFTLLLTVVLYGASMLGPISAQQPEQPSQRYQPLRTIPSTAPAATERTTIPTVKATVPTASELATSAPRGMKEQGNQSQPNASARSQFAAQQVNYQEPGKSQGTNLPPLLDGPQSSLIARPDTLSRVNQSAASQPKLPLTEGPGALASPTSPNNQFAAPSNGPQKTSPRIISLASPKKVPQTQPSVLPSSNTSNFPLAKQTGTALKLGQSNRTRAMMELSAPAIRVQSFGPQTIGINQASSFQVQVSNTGSQTANNIQVGIHLPLWVDIENLDASSGLFKLTDGGEQARIVWTLDQVSGNATETIRIPATPRKAELFDLGVEWTFLPKTVKSSVAVTQPKLEMTISGPEDILYGDKAVYQVEIRNPGTGIAEQVMIKLPEALGGESQTIGNIPPGDSQRFQIELFARTAGVLDLLATASATGELTTSVQRKVYVRRANLEVKLTGPARKYAGTDAKYKVTVTNRGDALAQDVMAAVALPSGVEYQGGLDRVEQTRTDLTWQVGSMKPGESETFDLNFVLNTSGELQLEVGARGAGDLAATSQCVTSVQTVADLTLSVVDPRGPLPTG